MLLEHPPASVLAAYGLSEESLVIKPFGTGLIHSTWRVSAPGGDYILQRINHGVFKSPESIAHNIRLIGAYLKAHHPDYLFVAPHASRQGQEMIHVLEAGFFRLFPFVPFSHSLDVVKTPDQAYEAALQFGRFTRMLSAMDVSQLKVTIPHFHDLSLRFGQFLGAIEAGNRQRIRESNALIQTLMGYKDIVVAYERIKRNPDFRLRVAHHDTKISNVLFDPADRGICVIDLDTVMPGYFISDVGDMMRTYLSPVSEEETDFDHIVVRDEIYKAIVKGYCNEMQDELTHSEQDHLFYAGIFMTFMQAIRFLTDHLNDDMYYGARYPGHNFNRAKNQTVLLQRLLEKEATLAAYKV